MTESENATLFSTKVLPIMDSVMKDLQQKQLEEVGRHSNSLSFLFAGAAGHDGGAAAQMASLDSLRYTGKWNSKHTEDYIEMVKEQLQQEKIEVTPEIEKQMIDKMIQDKIPKSSIDYIMKKAATSTLFYLPQALNKSPLENHIDDQAEKAYNPSDLEKGAGWALGSTADLIGTGGFMGGWGSAAKFIGFDLVMNAVMDKLDSSEDDDIPLVIAPEYREQYKAEQAQAKEVEAEQESATKEEKPKAEPVPEPKKEESQQPVVDPQQTQTSNTDGWSGLLSTFGLNGLGDIGHNLGYVLAMLPDILVGLFTGKTKSLGLKDNIMPIASIVAGMFVKNPILKMVLIGMGGANLLNKAGHEAMDMQNGNERSAEGQGRKNYKTYSDEALDPRISQPQIRGNCLFVTIDRLPCTIALPDKVVDAYQQGALPLYTLANAVLAKNDQMRQMASDNYSANEQQTQTRSLAQR